jgi:hypothetical protein
LELLQLCAPRHAVYNKCGCHYAISSTCLPIIFARNIRLPWQRIVCYGSFTPKELVIPHTTKSNIAVLCTFLFLFLALFCHRFAVFSFISTRFFLTMSFTTDLKCLSLTCRLLPLFLPSSSSYFW